MTQNNIPLELHEYEEIKAGPLAVTDVVDLFSATSIIITLDRSIPGKFGGEICNNKSKADGLRAGEEGDTEESTWNQTASHQGAHKRNTQQSSLLFKRGDKEAGRSDRLLACLPCSGPLCSNATGSQGIHWEFAEIGQLVTILHSQIDSVSSQYKPWPAAVQSICAHSPQDPKKVSNTHSLTH
ncbi:hypothetical protein EYF80_001623 [Liparis tanakae]|uniref:Uncharacterized protein n=1 Tax=Liparis tanakae TaxID=230148 RepID=A0A4Z2JFK5_9TELE|nr:hypothetical protein EYF80_001623 [Liparis tanakae]